MWTDWDGMFTGPRHLTSIFVTYTLTGVSIPSMLSVSRVGSTPRVHALWVTAPGDCPR